MKFKKIVGATAVAAGMAVAANSHAIQWLFDSTGDSFTAHYDLSVGGAHLMADVNFTLTSIAASSATFDVTINNLTVASDPGQNRLVSFGVDIVAPALTSTSANNGWGSTLTTNFPGFQQVDLCVWDGNNCAGGGNQGVNEQSTEMFNLTVATAGDFTASGITFDSPFPTKWQSVGTQGKSYEFDTSSSSTSSSTSSSGSQVSEPAILVLLGIGLLGQALIFRNRRRLGLA